jgi:hypothetical protein
MTTAFRTAYKSLLLDYLPRPVRTQREYEQVCRQIAKLMSAGPELPQAESELLEILIPPGASRASTSDLPFFGTTWYTIGSGRAE